MPHDMVTFQHSAPPAHIAASPPPVSLNANAQQGIRIPFPVISIEGRRWSVTHRSVETMIQASPGFDVNGRPLPEAPVSALNVIVVGISAAISKSWYAQAFRPGVKILMPDCFSTNGETPDPQSPKRQSPVCATCPHNQFGSAVSDDGSQGKGKACRDGRKIAVVPGGDVKNVRFGGSPMMLRLPVMSMPNLARYCGELNITGVDISQVVTSMSFNSAIEVKYPEVVFSAVDYIQNPADYSAVQDWMRSDIVRQMLDEAPTFENTGVSPVHPTREQFHIPSETRSGLAQNADKQLNNEPNPNAWMELLSQFAAAASSASELTEIFALSCVKQAREMAPLSVRQRIQGMLDAAVDRLSPRDDPPPPTASPEPPTPPAPTEPSSERDSAGVAWDAALHASTKAKKADGTWRARRGAEPAQVTDGIAPSAPQWDSDHAAQEPERADPPAGLAGQQPSPPATPAGFEAWLVDAEGDPIADEAGDLSAYRNPIEFVKHYLVWLDEQTPETRDGYVSANQEAIVAAQIASKEVSRLLADHQRRPARATDYNPDDLLPMNMPVDQSVVPAPAKMGKADVEQYLGQLRIKLSSATTVDSAVHLGAANRVVFGKFPEKYRLASEGIVADRCKDLTPPAKGATETPRDLANRLLSDIAGLTSMEACGAWLAMPAVGRAMDSLYHDALPLADEVTRALTAKRSEFGPIAKSPRQIADDLITAVKGCRTFKEVKGLAAIPKNVTSDDFLEKNHPDLWAEVRAVVDLQRRNLPEG